MSIIDDILSEVEQGAQSSSPTPSPLFQESNTEIFHILEKTTEKAKPYFKNPNYYKDVLAGTGELAQRMHTSLTGFLKTENAEERSLHRNRIITIYWKLITDMTQKIQMLSEPKRLFLRFGILLPNMLTDNQRNAFACIIENNSTGIPIHYMDEWLLLISTGDVSPSATDETKSPAISKTHTLESLKGRIEAQMEIICMQNRSMSDMETNLQALVRQFVDRKPLSNLNGEKGPYTEAQRSLISGIQSHLRRLSHMGKEFGKIIRDYEKNTEEYEKTEKKIAGMGDNTHLIDDTSVMTEVDTVRQMAKLSVGKQGNHFPILCKQYFQGEINNIATRENIHNVLAEIERLDPSVFQRTYKQKVFRIVPHIILLPYYGDMGVCWEPFERKNRATSRGRLVIPMYPKELKLSIIAALGDLRWQVAKEKAAHYWMEEGLTGWYYQWFTNAKLKGDVKDQFIQDYILWINKESTGMQKLSKEVRGIFWRNIPFPQEVKEDLKLRGFSYADLYKKDKNRSISDGY